MKKSISILLLSLMFFSQIGYQALYLIQQLIIREEQKELAFSLLPESSLEIIKDNKSIDWEEKGKEFYLNNNMYDVVKTKIIHGEKIFFVVNDKKESEVLKKFENIVRAQQDNNQNKKSNDLGIKFHQIIFTLNSFSDPLLLKELFAIYHIHNENITSSYSGDILIPPPQC